MGGLQKNSLGEFKEIRTYLLLASEVRKKKKAY